jgi:phage-related protein
VVAIKAVDEASGVMDKIRSSIGVLGASLGQLGGGFTSVGNIMSGFAAGGVAGAAAAGVGELIKTMQWASEEAAKSEQVWADLQAAVGATGPTWDSIRGEIEKMAATIQKTTVFSDEAVVGAIQRMTTFGMSYADAMKSVNTVVDLAAAKHLDLQTAADLVGKAFTGNLAILQRYGIDVDGLKKSLGAGATDAQIFTAVLAKLNDQFGGQAAEQAKTYAGAQERLKNAISDMGEKLGGVLLPALAGMTEAMIPLVDWLTQGIVKVQQWIDAVSRMPEVKAATDAVTQAFAGLQDWFGKTAQAMAEILGPAFKDLFEALGEVWDALQPIFEAFGELWNAIAGGEGSGNAFKDLMGLIAINIKGVAAAIKAVVPIIRMIADAFKEAADFLAPIIRSIVDAVAWFFAQLRNAFQGFYDWLVGKSLWTDLWANMQSIAMNAISGLISILMTNLLEPLETAFQNTLGGIQTVIIDSFTKAAGYVAQNFPLLTKGILEGLVNLSDSWSKAWADISEIPSKLLSVAATYIVGALQDFTAAFKAALTEAFTFYKTTWDTVWGQLTTTAKTQWDNIVSFARSAINQFMAEFDKLPGFFSALGGRLMGALQPVIDNIKNALGNLVSYSQNQLQGFWNWLSGHSMWPEMWGEVLQQTQTATGDIAEAIAAGTGQWQGAIGGFEPLAAAPVAAPVAPTAGMAAAAAPGGTEAMIPINIYIDGQQIAGYIERRITEALSLGRSKRTSIA